MAKITYDQNSGKVTSVTGNLSNSTVLKKNAAGVKEFTDSGGKIGVEANQNYGVDKTTGLPVGVGNDAKPGEEVKTPIADQTKAIQESLTKTPALATPQTTTQTTPSTLNPNQQVPIPAQTQKLLDQYRGMQGALETSGVSAPGNAGAANAAIQQVADKFPSGTPSSLSQVFNPQNYQDAFSQGIQQMMADRQEFLKEENQRGSLTDEYTKLMKQSGIPALNTELMNMKNVIDGTEDDIRNEVTKAGGFATDSQVMALSAARNKVLIKNYNNLLETKQQAQDMVNTMIGLEEKDRQYAHQQFQEQMQFDQQIVDYGYKMQQNAIQQLDRTVDAIGWDGLYSSTQGNPYYQSMLEKTYGLPQGGLQQAATYAKQQRAFDQQKQKLQLDQLQSSLDTDVLQRQKLRADIHKIENPTNEYGTLNAKPQTIQQAQANGFADRMTEANKSLSALDSKFASTYAIGGFLPNFLKSSDRQVYEQAQRNFINAVLRRESGAAISDTEYASYAKQYFSQAGDSPETVVQKQQNRNTSINNLYREANIPRPTSPGDIIEDDAGNQYKVGPDGESLELIKEGLQFSVTPQ